MRRSGCAGQEDQYRGGRCGRGDRRRASWSRPRPAGAWSPIRTARRSRPTAATWRSLLVRDDLGGPIDTDALNIYVYDRKRKKVQLVSRQSRSAGGAGGDDYSSDPSISASGRYVAFRHGRRQPWRPDRLRRANVYVYDRKRKKVQLVSRQSRSAGGAGADANSLPAEHLSEWPLRRDPDGGRQPRRADRGRDQHLRLRPRAQEDSARLAREPGRRRRRRRRRLAGRQPLGQWPLRRDLRPTRTTSADRSIPTARTSTSTTASASGSQLVSRQSRAAGGAGADTLLVESRALRQRPASSPFTPTPTTSADPPTSTTPTSTSTTASARRSGSSRARADRPAATAPTDSFSTDISASGRIVAFQTEADNLGGPIDDGVDNVYAYDRKRKKVVLVSRQSRSAGGDGCDASCISPQHLGQRSLRRLLHPVRRTSAARRSLHRRRTSTCATSSRRKTQLVSRPLVAADAQPAPTSVLTTAS